MSNQNTAVLFWFKAGEVQSKELNKGPELRDFAKDLRTKSFAYVRPRGVWYYHDPAVEYTGYFVTLRRVEVNEVPLEVPPAILLAAALII